jgi:tetratricopeptide (TPR) repeat protein
MWSAVHLRRGLGVLTLAVLAPWAGAAGDALGTARELAAAQKWSEVVAAIEAHLRFDTPTPALDDLLAQALAKLGRRDEAAHYLERAYNALPDGDKEAAKLRKRLIELDPLFARREALWKRGAKELFDGALALDADGQHARALEACERALPLARGSAAAPIAERIAKLRSHEEEVDLEAGGSQRPPTGWPLLQLESERYILAAHLEPAVAELLGRTMDRIFASYVQIYFDGDAAQVPTRKATIHIHPSQDAMLAGWTGGSRPGGWWSPGEWSVHAYDTRSDRGSLDQMLETLFHEASHQFMTILSRGGAAPAWLNEGTACFFEGATAMADGTVLWPDAATERLAHLYRMLTSGGGPSFADVVNYDSPGSYAGEYYPWGWGIVYFLQQYEDPVTLEHSFRPLYEAYRDKVLTSDKGSRAVFDEVFLGPLSPRGHRTLEHFEAEWKRWILDHVHPLHFATNRRALRMQEVERYLAAAKAVAGSKTAKVGEKELLRRALGHLEHIRKQIDDPTAPAPELLLAQADILERIGEPAAAAPLLEALLELYAEGKWETSDEAFELLTKRLAKLDKKNSALVTARARTRQLANVAKILVQDYRKGKADLTLRTYNLARQASVSFDDANGALGELSDELRTLARERGLLRGNVQKLSGALGMWQTIFTNLETGFDAQADRVTLQGVRPVGRICTAIELRGEYEVRARVTQQGEPRMGAHHGLVIAGMPKGDWAVVTLDHEGRLNLKRLVFGSGGGVTDTTTATVKLANPPKIGEPFDFCARVFPDNSIEVMVGEQGPFPLRLPIARTQRTHAGIYVKYGSIALDNPVVEVFP